MEQLCPLAQWQPDSTELLEHIVCVQAVWLCIKLLWAKLTQALEQRAQAAEVSCNEESQGIDAEGSSSALGMLILHAFWPGMPSVIGCGVQCPVSTVICFASFELTSPAMSPQVPGPLLDGAGSPSMSPCR